MKRLFVKVTTSPKGRRTLVEMRGDRPVVELLHHLPIVLEQDQVGRGSSSEMRLARLGPRLTILDSAQSLDFAGIRNGDTLLLMFGETTLKGSDFFDYTSIVVAKEGSIQELRQPLRAAVGPEFIMEEGYSPSAPNTPAIAPSPSHPTDTTNASFDRANPGTPLADPAVDAPNVKKPQVSPNPLVPPTWKKVDTSNL